MRRIKEIKVTVFPSGNKREVLRTPKNKRGHTITVVSTRYNNDINFQNPIKI
tara:strand:+ start:390 stop:545 length:156 start_codon:yes stop_codon:yes gene_type:complete